MKFPEIFLTGNLMPGVRIKDNGPKAGLNGVDNGGLPSASYVAFGLQYLALDCANITRSDCLFYILACSVYRPDLV